MISVLFSMVRLGGLMSVFSVFDAGLFGATLSVSDRCELSRASKMHLSVFRATNSIDED